jgi:hypothetical protein
MGKKDLLLILRTFGAGLLRLSVSGLLWLAFVWFGAMGMYFWGAVHRQPTYLTPAVSKGIIALLIMAALSVVAALVLNR